jgi:hypothetical protein
MYFPTSAIKEYFKKHQEFSLTEEELDKLVDIFYAFFAVIVNNNNIVSTDKTQEKRKEICLKCPSFDENSSSCNICGCFIPDKITKPSERCPIDKWTMDLKLVRELLIKTVQYIDNNIRESGDNIITIEDHEESMLGK